MSQRINFIVTDAQRFWLDQRVAESGMNLTDYIKSRLGMDENATVLAQVTDLERRVSELETFYQARNS